MHLDVDILTTLIHLINDLTYNLNELTSEFESAVSARLKSFFVLRLTALSSLKTTVCVFG